MYAIKDDKDHEESVYMALVDVSGLNPKTNEDDKKEICVSTEKAVLFLKYKTCLSRMSMKAVVVHEYGDSTKLSYEDISIPEVGKGEVLVKKHFCGVNFIDIVWRNGFMAQRFSVDSTLGFEGSGVVEKVGDGVVDVAVGDNVAYMGLGAGSYAEYSKVPSWRVIKPMFHLTRQQVHYGKG
ncbi:hypothetical protein QZH41_008444 [Actinostola sp. cb2023]|nr:hypothetical protein QZH41_008444 [Actinostola sp. cb2023]